MISSILLSLLMSFGPGAPGPDSPEVPAAPPSSIHLSEFLSPGADIAGTWRITQAGGPDGDNSYTGTVTLQKLADYVYAVKWQTSVGSYAGVGILDGANLYVGWGIDADHGVAVYKTNGSQLEGTWAASGGASGTGTETVTLTGGNLVGNHRLLGNNPNNAGAYRGTLDISENGATYIFKWSTAGTTYAGVGIKVGNIIAVGWGMGPNHGVVHYAFSGNSAQGKWAVPGMARLATENIAR
jgi:hypothetical protein